MRLGRWPKEMLFEELEKYEGKDVKQRIGRHSEKMSIKLLEKAGFIVTEWRSNEKRTGHGYDIDAEKREKICIEIKTANKTWEQIESLVNASGLEKIALLGIYHPKEGRLRLYQIDQIAELVDS